MRSPPRLGLELDAAAASGVGGGRRAQNERDLPDRSPSSASAAAPSVAPSPLLAFAQPLGIDPAEFRRAGKAPLLGLVPPAEVIVPPETTGSWVCGLIAPALPSPVCGSGAPDARGLAPRVHLPEPPNQLPLGWRGEDEGGSATPWNGAEVNGLSAASGTLALPEPLPPSPMRVTDSLRFRSSDLAELVAVARGADSADAAAQVADARLHLLCLSKPCSARIDRRRSVRD